MHITQYGGLDPSRDMVQGPQIWGARGPDMGPPPRAIFASMRLFGPSDLDPLFRGFMPFWDPFGQYPPNGDFRSQTLVLDTYRFLRSKGISINETDPNVQFWTSMVQ